MNISTPVFTSMIVSVGELAEWESW